MNQPNEMPALDGMFPRKGLGSCCIDRSKFTFATPYGMELRKSAGIPADYVPQLHVVLGYPESTARDHRTLYSNRVTWV